MTHARHLLEADIREEIRLAIEAVAADAVRDAKWESAKALASAASSHYTQDRITRILLRRFRIIRRGGAE